MGKKQGLPDHLDTADAAQFPHLEASAYQVTSPQDAGYNCIAYAAGDQERWWEPLEFPRPGYYWPEGAQRGMTIDALQSCYETLGYEVCESGDPEDRYVKIALYADPDGSWTHAARQVEGGEWSSKLGRNFDIRHRDPQCVGGPVYGEVAMFMRKPAGGTS